MKKIIILLSGLAVIVLGMLFLAFTQSGNKLLLPYVNSYLKKNYPAMQINVTDLRLKPGSLMLKATMQKSIEIKVDGPIDAMRQSFDLIYQVDAGKIETEAITINRSMHVSGNMKGTAENMDIVGKGSAFNSNIDYTATLADRRVQKMHAALKNASVEELLAVAGQPNYAKGKVSLEVDLSQNAEDKLVGDYTLKSSGNAVTDVVKKTLDLNLGKTFTYNVSANGTIKEEKLHADVKADTTMGKVTLPDMTYDYNSGTLLSSYRIYISDLRKLQPLTKRAFRGDMDFSGELRKEKTVTVTGHGKEFGGTVDYALKGDRISAHAKGATVSKIMYMLGYPQVLEALTEAKVDYNLATQRGTVDAEMERAQLLSSTLTVLLKQLLQIDLDKFNYPTASFNAKIDRDVSRFNFNANNSSGHFKINDGMYNKASNAIDAAVDISVDGKDIKGKISGTVDHPEVGLDTEGLIKSKIEKQFKKVLDKKSDDKVKNLLKGLF